MVTPGYYFVTFIDKEEDIIESELYKESILKKLVTENTIFGIPKRKIPWGTTVIVPYDQFKENTYNNKQYSFKFPINNDDCSYYNYPSFIIKSIYSKLF